MLCPVHKDDGARNGVHLTVQEVLEHSLQCLNEQRVAMYKVAVGLVKG